MRDNQLKLEKLSQYVEAMVASGRFRAGMQLPTLKELGAQFLLSESSTRRCIQKLCEAGLLELRHGKGTFVRPSREQQGRGKHRIALFQDLPHERNYGSHVIHGVLEAARQNGAIAEFHSVPYGTPQEMREMQSLLDELSSSCDAVIIVGSYDMFVSELSSRIPVVGVEMDHHFGGLVSPLSLDTFGAAELAVEFFRERGVTRVQVVSEKAPVTMRRAEIFSLYWPDCEIVQDCDFERDDIGYLFTGGSRLHSCWQEYRQERGQEPPVAERTVLSMDGKALLVPDFGPVTPAVMPDWRDGGHQAFQEAMRRVRQPGCGGSRIYLRTRLEYPKTGTTE